MNLATYALLSFPAEEFDGASLCKTIATRAVSDPKDAVRFAATEALACAARLWGAGPVESALRDAAGGGAGLSLEVNRNTSTLTLKPQP